MKYKITIAIAVLFTLNLHAQFTDNMETYTDGASIFEGHWTDWTGNGTNPIYASSTHAVSGSLSGYIPPNGTTDGILNLGNQTEGDWGLKFMMYIPSGREGYINIQGVVPPGSSPIYGVGDIFFNRNNENPGVGYVDYDSSDSSNWSNFTFPHDQWFEVIINIAFAYTNTWQFIVNGNLVADWHTYSRWVGAGEEEETTMLGGIDFFSSSTNCEYWVDDFDFINAHHSSSLAIADNLNQSQLKIYPNPATNKLHITIDNADTNQIQILSLTGQVLYEQDFISEGLIDISILKKGVYLVKINSNATNSIVKKLVVE